MPRLSVLILTLLVVSIFPIPVHQARAAGDGSRIDRHTTNETGYATSMGREAEGVPFTARSRWTYGVLATGIGLSCIVAAQNGDHREIYTPASIDTYWVALRYDPASNGYDEIFMSPIYVYTTIAQIVVADVVGDPRNEILVAVTDGTIYLYDQESKSEIGVVHTGISNLKNLAVADVDDDFQNELVVCTLSTTSVLSEDGTLEWRVSSAGGVRLVIDQMDDDAALEIALTGGSVIDTSSHSVQWTWPDGFGYDVESGDIDADGRSELVVATANTNLITAFDVEGQLPKWSFPASLDKGGVTVADVTGDQIPEIVVGQSGFSDIFVYDGMTLAEIGYMDNPVHGVTNVIVADADGDGDIDLVWGAGYTWSADDYLYAADWGTKQITWQNEDLVAPFLGPLIGDLDGDGRQELVIASTESDSGYGSGQILVFDARSHELLGISPEFGNSLYGPARDLRLRDIDDDGKQEIVVTVDGRWYGAVEIYAFDRAGETFVRRARYDSIDYPEFSKGDVVDIDGDGANEVIGIGFGNIWVLNGVTGVAEWVSPDLTTYYFSGLEVADVDGDLTLEIIALGASGNVYIYDGITKEAETVLQGRYSALTLDTSTGGLPVIVLGTQSGELVEFAASQAPNPSPYVEIGRQQTISEIIRGITIDARGRAWMGGTGTLSVFDTDATLLWSDTGDSNSYGRRVAFLPGSSTFFTTTYFGIKEYVIGTGFGLQTVGIYNASGTFFLRNTLEPGPADVAFGYGPISGWQPVIGDWDRDSIDTIGLYDPMSGFFFLRDENTPGAADLVYGFGPAGAGWIPLAGDWNGDGIDTIGLYDPASGFFFLRDTHAPGGADRIVGFGPVAGWSPIVGDWDGDGVDSIGLYDPTTGFFFLRNAIAPGAADLVYGFGPAGAGWQPIVGDWNGDGIDTIGLYDPGTGFFFLRDVHAPGPADRSFGFGAPGNTPLGGDWDAQ